MLKLLAFHYFPYFPLVLSLASEHTFFLLLLRPRLRVLFLLLFLIFFLFAKKFLKPTTCTIIARAKCVLRPRKCIHAKSAFSRNRRRERKRRKRTTTTAATTTFVSRRTDESSFDGVGRVEKRGEEIGEIKLMRTSLRFQNLPGLVPTTRQRRRLAVAV